MLGWLALFSLLLGVLFLYLVVGEASLDHVAGWPVAAAVAFSLLALYAVATGGLREAGRLRRLLPSLLVLSVLGAAAYYIVPRLDMSPLLARLAGNGEAGGTAADPVAGSLTSVRIRKNENGQFIARGDIDGAQTTFLVDSGASAVILRQSDARKAGIDTAALQYTVPVKTANGETTAAAVRLRSLTIGTIRMEGVEALVAEPGNLNENLLGITFLRRLRSYEISGDFLTLRE
jgi:aspartyl protease family protein